VRVRVFLSRKGKTPEAQNKLFLLNQAFAASSTLIFVDTFMPTQLSRFTYFF
jgi:hypothetical protein